MVNSRSGVPVDSGVESRLHGPAAQTGTRLPIMFRGICMNNGKNDLGGGAIAPVAAENLHRIESSSQPLGPRIAKIADRLRNGIGFRLLAAVLLFSSVVTLTLTALQLYLDYDHEVGVIETRLDEIGRSYLATLGESLWALDQNQLQLQLNGILRLPGIR